jgi:hypothetical protein
MGQFITPPSIPSDVYCRTLLIPNSPEWIGTITGALLPLIYASEWVKTTGIEPEEAAQRALEMFNLYVNSGNDGECGDMPCCDQIVTLHRFNPETGRPEISTDGGTTWKSDPADVQNLIPLYPPLVNSGSDKTKCDAATNASEHINELITATGDQLSTAGDIFTLCVGIAEAILALFLILVSAGALTAPVTAIATAIWAAGSAAFALGHDAYLAYWTTDKKDAILCALYCNIGSSGQFTDAQYSSFVSKVKSTLPASPALDIVMTSINAGGSRGLSQMASYGNAALADCSSCSCSNACVDLWSWPNGDFGANSTVVKDEENKRITAEALEIVPGNWYWAFQSDTCCNVVFETISGTVTAGFKGIIPCPDKPTFSYFSETIPPWSASFPDPTYRSAFVVFVRSTTPFTGRITFVDV